MLLRTYARLVAVVLVVGSVVGAFGWLALGKGSVILYLFTAGVFAFAGRRGRDEGFTRVVVGSFGGFYLGSGLVLTVLFVVMEFPFGGDYAEAFGLTALGALSIVCARVLPCDDDPTEEGQER